MTEDKNVHEQEAVISTASYVYGIKNSKRQSMRKEDDD